jgi:hypothetical protein
VVGVCLEDFHLLLVRARARARARARVGGRVRDRVRARVRVRDPSPPRWTLPRPQ